MTKEEARQSLVNTKVYVAGKSAEIQKKLFKLGFEWGFGEKKVLYTYIPFLYIYEKEITHGANMSDFSNHKHKEVTADYILNLTWKEEKPKFQPFDKVLVRDTNEDNWMPNLYFRCRNIDSDVCFWEQIIPYEGNEHLAYTNNSPE